jgi:hypothetical protein
MSRTNQEILRDSVSCITSLLWERRDELSYVMNFDKTYQRLYPDGNLTWAKKGTDEVSLDIRGN